MLPARVLTLLLCVLLAAPAAYADKDRTTRVAARHFKRAEKLFAVGRFDEALTHYERAYQAKPLPHFLFNIGQCHRNLGNYNEAIFSFRKYLKQWPDAPNREAVAKLLSELEERREAERARAREQRDRELTGAPPATAGSHNPTTNDDGGGIHTKWWFWTGLVAVAAGATAGLLYTRSGGDELPASSLGNLDFPR